MPSQIHFTWMKLCNEKSGRLSSAGIRLQTVLFCGDFRVFLDLHLYYYIWEIICFHCSLSQTLQNKEDELKTEINNSPKGSQPGSCEVNSGGKIAIMSMYYEAQVLGRFYGFRFLAGKEKLQKVMVVLCKSL